METYDRGVIHVHVRGSAAYATPVCRKGNIRVALVEGVVRGQGSFFQLLHCQQVAMQTPDVARDAVFLIVFRPAAAADVSFPPSVGGDRAMQVRGVVGVLLLLLRG